jgi:hypothetical protein
MRKLIIAMFFMASVCASCEKDSEFAENMNPDVKEQAVGAHQKVGDVNVKVGSPFEPIRLARAKTAPNHAGTICGCNECFGLCNAPHNSQVVGGMLGIEELPGSKANLYFLKELPSNFEKEFGVDESFYFKNTNGDTIYTIAIGVYSAFKAEGIAKDSDTGTEYPYFAKVQVNLE